MGGLARTAKWLLAVVSVPAAGLAGWLAVAPPELILVGTAYAAKIVCSNQFLAGRDGQTVLASDVQAPGHPLLRYVTVDVDPVERTVAARLFGLFAERRAIHRDGAGCAVAPRGGTVAALPALASAGTPDMDALWPAGERVEPSPDPALAAILDDPVMTGPGMRAVVVVHNGRIVAERYGAGFDARTPLLGWSMTKTVTAALVGASVREGRLSLGQDGLFEAWNGEERGAITVTDLMAMSSGLAFNEDYGGVSDVTRMLYLEADMAGFAATRPPSGRRGETFNYSSGETMLLSRVWQDAFADPADALAFPREALFSPLGMTSAVLEADATGSFAGASYLYAAARDWARFGEFLRNDGVWEGRRILPEGLVPWMREAAPASGGVYGRGHLWLQGPAAGMPAGQSPDLGLGLPDDTFWLIGHDGQSTAVVPSRNMVVVRMGLTPSRLGYRPQAMVAALARALR